MMLDDYLCETCNSRSEGWRDDPPRCRNCNRPMQRLIGGHNFEWGSPRLYRTLREEPFSSRSEKNEWAKSNGFSEAGDKVGGARNEEHRGLGKLFSYPGAPTS